MISRYSACGHERGDEPGPLRQIKGMLTKFPTMANGARYVDMNPRPSVKASKNHATASIADSAQIVNPRLRRLIATSIESNGQEVVE